MWKRWVAAVSAVLVLLTVAPPRAEGAPAWLSHWLGPYGVLSQRGTIEEWLDGRGTWYWKAGQWDSGNRVLLFFAVKPEQFSVEALHATTDAPWGMALLRCDPSAPKGYYIIPNSTVSRVGPGWLSIDTSDPIVCGVQLASPTHRGSEVEWGQIAVQFSAPDPPIGLVAIAGDRQVQLAWLPPPGAVAYRVYRDGHFVREVRGTQFLDTGLTNWVTYTYEVRTVGLYGQESAPATVQATPEDPPPPVPPPGAPQNLVADAGDGFVRLTWDMEPGITYEIRRADGRRWTRVTSPWVDRSVVNGRTYTYEVIPVNAAGVPGPAATVTATPQAGPVTDAPHLTGNAIGVDVYLRWTGVPGASQYVLVRDGVEVAVVSDTQYRDRGLQPFYTYSYVVRGRNQLGDGPESNVLVLRTGSDRYTGITPGTGGSVGAGGGLLEAARKAWSIVWPVALGLIALVWLMFWLIRRTKKAVVQGK